MRDRLKLSARLRPYDVSTREGRSLERQRRTALTIVSNLAARMASFAIIVLSTRFALEDVGVERFGIWMTIASLLILLNFLDFGIGNALVGPIARFSARSDQKKELSATISRGIAVTVIIGMIATAILLLIVSNSPLELLFRDASAANLREASEVLVLFSVMIGISLPLQTTFRIMAGLQRAYISHSLSFIISVLVLVFLFLSRDSVFNISIYLLLTFGCAQISGLLTLILLIKERVVRFSILTGDDLAKYRILFSSGGLFLALQVGSLIGWGSDQVLISALSGPGDAGVYAIAFRIFMLVTIPIYIINAPMWAYYAQAMSSGDTADVRKSFKFSFFTSFFLSTSISTCLVLNGPWLWTLLSGNEVAFNGRLLISFAIWTIIDSCANAFAMLLNAAGIIKEQLFGITLFVLLSIPTKIYLIKNYGYENLPVLTSSIYISTIFLIFGLVYRKKIMGLLFDG